MEDKLMDSIDMVSEVFASSKRLLMMDFLKEEPIGYTEIVQRFEKAGVPIGSSEVYKHIWLLLEKGFINRKGHNYILTRRGFVALNRIMEIADTSPDIPRMEMKF